MWGWIKNFAMARPARVPTVVEDLPEAGGVTELGPAPEPWIGEAQRFLQSEQNRKSAEREREAHESVERELYRSEVDKVEKSTKAYVEAFMREYNVVSGLPQPPPARMSLHSATWDFPGGPGDAFLRLDTLNHYWQVRRAGSFWEYSDRGTGGYEVKWDDHLRSTTDRRVALTWMLSLAKGEPACDE